MIVAACFLTNPASKKDDPKPAQTVSDSAADSETGSETGYEMIKMVPSNITSEDMISSYLYIPIDGVRYRYTRSEADPKSVTVGEMLYSFKRADDTWSIL